MKYSGILKNDFNAAPGISVTLFVSGCDFHCPGCHNPEAQNFEYGDEFTPEVAQEIIETLNANGINRTLCIMGGEPLHPKNRKSVRELVARARGLSPQSKIYIWTGYTYEQLCEEYDMTLDSIFMNIDALIDGPYIETQRDVTLKMRGSRNQRIFYLTNGEIFDIIK